MHERSREGAGERKAILLARVEVTDEAFPKANFRLSD